MRPLLQVAAEDAEAFAATPIGTGPYAVTSYTEGVELVVQANPEHWDGPPPHASLRWVAEPEPDRRLAALRSGAADVATKLGPAALQEEGPGLSTAEVLDPTAIIYLLNGAREAFQDPRVRRALSLAIDREGLVADVLGGAGRPLYSALSPAHLGGLPLAGAPAANVPSEAGVAAAQVPALAARQQQARDLLAAAGHGDGLTLAVDCPTALPDEAQALTAAVAEQLRAVGVELAVTTHEDRTAYAHMVRRSEVSQPCAISVPSLRSPRLSGLPLLLLSQRRA